jgi:S-adenosylmethionine-dependent methyltransferase
LRQETDETRQRVELVQSSGEEAPEVLHARFGVVLCHGVVMYLDEPGPLLDALVQLAEPRGVVSIVAKNVEALAVRPALDGDWGTALRMFDSERQVNGLGLETRGDSVSGLSAALAQRGVEAIRWYGVRLFTDGWTPDRPADDPEDAVLAVELEASRRDPYRRLSRLFHLIGRKADAS